MPEAILRVPTPSGFCWRHFFGPSRVLSANLPADLQPLLAEVERAAAEGGIAVGFIAYEAAAAFDSALSVRTREVSLPLAQFLIFESSHDLDSLPDDFKSDPQELAAWAPDLSEAAHAGAIARIRSYIGAGDTYQVNLTHRLRSRDPNMQALFAEFAKCPKTGFTSYLDFGDWVVASASPELFLEREEGIVRTRPMKGTAPRGKTAAEDGALTQALAASEKDRAENLMILDMARNDLGRIAKTGSVKVEQMFRIERYATVHQMTSTVSARSSANLYQLLQATFPPASMTGAPKRRTMEIIRELETSPRGIYSGCLGIVGPGDSIRLAVAIRTAVLDRTSGAAEYGVGGGIVWDSDPKKEWAECQTKVRVLTDRLPEFSLFETLRFTPDEGFSFLDRHLDRLEDSSSYFDFEFDREAIRQTLADLERKIGCEERTVRLTLSRAGQVQLETLPMRAWREGGPRVAIASQRVDPSDRFLYHKTTLRRLYVRALEEFPEADDVLLANTNGELTESARANIAVRLGDKLFTPPIRCGLLPGTLRAEMIERGQLEERVIPLEALRDCVALHLLNSVRGFSPAIDPGAILQSGNLAGATP